MEDKPKPPANADDPAESKRFIDMAREIEVDERPASIDEAFKRVVPLPEAPREKIDRVLPSGKTPD